MCPHNLHTKMPFLIDVAEEFYKFSMLFNMLLCYIIINMLHNMLFYMLCNSYALILKNGYIKF